MLFEAYVDESVNQPETNFTVAGFIGPNAAWIDLAPKWLAVIPPEFEYFHATDCFSGYKKFKGVSVDRRIELIDALTGLIIDADIKLGGYGVDVEAYKQFAPKLRQNEFGINKYAVPFGFLIKLACQVYLDSRYPLTPFPKQTDDVCAFFIEDSDWAPTARRVIQSEKQVPLYEYWRNRIGTDTYGKKAPDKHGSADVIPLLQVADYGAFLSNKFLTNALDGEIAWRPYFEKLKSANKICHQLENLTPEKLKVFFAIHSAIKLEEQGRDLWNEIRP